ncbi:MAG: ThiF family adenylyltransferase [Thermoplasmata archaeon]|nr:ThiF family adenylyltransferase [Thermoplasmata archaeon]
MEGDEEFWDRQDRLWPGFRERVKSMTAMVVGVGATGSYAALFTAQMGFKRLVLVDPDRVELSNLNRTVYTLKDVDEYKAVAMKRIVVERVPGVEVKAITKRIEELPKEAISADIILSCLDVMDARFYLTELAYRKGIPLFDVGTEGERIRVQSSIPPGPCLACTIPVELYGEIVGLKDSCTGEGSEHAPSGPLVPPIASSLLLYVVKRYLEGEEVLGTVIYLNTTDLEVRVERIKRNPTCFICSNIR